MVKPLIICEKLIQAEKIVGPFPHHQETGYIVIHANDIFPDGAIVAHAFGHILQLKEPQDYDENWLNWSIESLPISPADNQFQYEIDPSKNTEFQVIKNWMASKQISYIVNTGSPGREGQAIIDEILQYLNNKKTVKRFWSTSLSSKAVRRAFLNLKDNNAYLPLYKEFLARQHSDWIIGMNFTRLMTKLIQDKGIEGENATFSIDRCQIPLISIIYERELAVESFVSKQYWDLSIQIKGKKGTFEAQWFNEEQDHIYQKNEVEALRDFCERKYVSIHDVKKELIVERPPEFYNLPSIQSAANKKFSFSSKRTLSILQRLYEQGLISYPSVKTRHVTKEEVEKFPTILDNLKDISLYRSFIPKKYPNLLQDKRYIDASKTGDYHNAIILTEDKIDPSQLDKEEKVIYDMIARSMIAAHLPSYEYEQMSVIALVEECFTFQAKGKQTVKTGWKGLYENKNVNETVLPYVEEGEIGYIHSIDCIEGVTKPPRRFTQGDLVNVMCNAKGYISDEERQTFIEDELSLGTEAKQADITEKIVKVGYIQIDKNSVFLQPKGRIIVETLKNESFFTSLITTGKMEQYLNEIGKGNKSYTDFIHRVIDISKERIPIIIDQSKEWDISCYQKYFQKVTDIGACPVCGEGMNDKDTFYGCNGYHKEQQCPVKISKFIAGKTISLRHVQDLLTKGQTSLITGFKKKNKEGTYNAFLVWDDKRQAVTFRMEGLSK